MKWIYLGGPKNNGYFGYMANGFFVIGRNHRPMSRTARKRFLSHPKKGILVA